MAKAKRLTNVQCKKVVGSTYCGRKLYAIGEDARLYYLDKGKKIYV